MSFTAYLRHVSATQGRKAAFFAACREVLETAPGMIVPVLLIAPMLIGAVVMAAQI